MPAETTPAPPPAPAAPVIQPPFDPTNPPAPIPQLPEDDPNIKLKQMISRRRQKPAEPDPEKPSETPEPKAPTPETAKKEEEPPKAAPPSLNSLIAGVLKMPVQKKPEVKAEPKPEPKKEEAAAPVEAPVAPKTIVGKKKAAPATPPVPDIKEITAAATTAAVRALQTTPSKPTDAARKPEDDLKPDDLHDYNVAMKLAEINPKYKDAPRVVLEQVKRSEQYAARWENANPGKEFDPDADEHNEFYDGLEKPWSDHEFRTAEIEMAAERVAAKTNRQADTKIKALEQDNARLELTPVINKAFYEAAGHLARELQVHDKIVNGSFDKLMETDPIAAEELAKALGPLQPIIEAIVQMDDPKGRFEYDKDNPAHQEWYRLLLEKEGQYAGVQNDDGKMFATRAAFHEMNQAQRGRHWFLTPDHLVTEVVQDAANVAAQRVKTEKERQKRIALSLGFVPAGEARPAASVTTPTNNGESPPAPDPKPETTKPISPSVGSGAKIDTKGGGSLTGKAALVAATHNILFGGS